MFRTSLPKLVLVLVLVTALAAPLTGWAAGRRFSSDDTWVRTENPLVMLWSYLTGLFEKEGCGIDPNGLCKNSTATSPTTTKEGCGIDPDGRCAPAPSPSGSTATNQDAGCGIDPSGGCTSGN